MTKLQCFFFLFVNGVGCFPPWASVLLGGFEDLGQYSLFQNSFLDLKTLGSAFKQMPLEERVCSWHFNVVVCPSQMCEQRSLSHEKPVTHTKCPLTRPPSRCQQMLRNVRIGWNVSMLIWKPTWRGGRTTRGRTSGSCSWEWLTRISNIMRR